MARKSYYIERRRKQSELYWQRIRQCQNEPRSHDGEVARGIAVGKALLLTEKTVPVRIMNLNHHPVNLRKGIVLGYCSSVSSVIRKLDAQENSVTEIQVQKITGELANLLSSSSRSLR
ncbi:hypothetical protein NQ318_022781, partial [Aromia moschata]